MSDNPFQTIPNWDQIVTAGTLPSVDPANPASYAAIKNGTDYLDPSGQKKTKFWRVDPAQPGSYDLIPEGADYLDPAGTKRSKPKSENVGLGSQTLFDMASGDPKKQREILTSFYGDNVKQDQQGFYVTQDGKRLRPSSGGGGITGALTRGTADLASQALPVAGATGGAILGTPAGGAGGVAGSALGYAGGSWANRAILALAGFGDDNWGGMSKVPRELAEGAAFEAGGQVVGKVAGQVAAAAKYGGQYVGEALGLPRLLRYAWNVTPEVAKKLGRLAEAGVHLPPQAAFPGAPILPILSSIGKRYDIDPVTPSVTKYASGKIKETTEALGIPSAEIGEPLNRTAEVDYAPAGEAMHRRYTEMLMQSKGELTKTFDEAEAAMRGQGTAAEGARQKALADAQAALEKNQAAARGILDAGWQDIRASVAQLHSGLLQEKPGDLVRAVAGKIGAARQAVGARYQDLYGKWDQLFGQQKVDVTEITDAAKSFLKDLPDDLTRNHPALVRAINDLDKNDTVAEGMTTGQLHHLRTMLGDVANWQTLAPSFKNGQLKYFRGVVDQSLRGGLPEEGRTMLETLDKGYRSDMAPFHDPTVQKMVDWTEANMPPGATTAGKTIMGAEPETRAYLQNLVGKPAWDAVVGADMQAAMDASKSIYPGEVDGAKFIHEFEHRDRAGILAAYPDAVAAKLRQQAQYVSEITDGGKAPLPVAIKRGDSFTDAMQGIYDSAKRVETLSKENPLKAMEDEVKRLRTEGAKSLRGVEEQYSTDPLGQILTNPNALLDNSARKIVRDPQLLATAAKRFGPESPEFKLLGNTYIKDVLTHSDVYELSKLSGELSGLTREQQEQIFSIKADDVILFAQNMKDILSDSKSTDAGKSIIASTAITHPASTPIPGAHALKHIATPLLRIPMSVLLKYTIAAYTHPAFFKFVAGSLRGTAEEQALAKALIHRFVQTGGIAGAAAGSALGSLPGGNVPGQPPVRDWRQDFQQKYLTQGASQ